MSGRPGPLPSGSRAAGVPARAALVALALAAGAPGCGGGGDDVVRRIDLLSSPAHVTVGAGAVWALTGDGLLKLDGEGKELGEVGTVEEPKVGISPGTAGIAVGEGGVWIANSDDGTVVKVDPERVAVAGKRVPVGEFESASGDAPMFAGRGGVWVGVEDSVVRLDPHTKKVAGPPIQVGGTPEGMAFAGDRLWVLIGVGTKRVPADERTVLGPSVVPEDQEAVSEPKRDGTLVSIDPRRRRLTGPRLKLRDPRDIAAGSGALWATEGTKVAPLDPRTGRRSGPPIDVGPSVTDLAVGEGAVWVTSPMENATYRVDPRTREVSEPIVMETENAEGVSAEIGDIAVGLGAVWIGSELEDALGRIDPGRVVD
jgi:streptogramin lyase